MYSQKYGYKLREGDILRFGKVKFRIKKMSKPKNDQQEIDTFIPEALGQTKPMRINTGRNFIFNYNS